MNEGVMTCTDCHNPHGAPAPTWRMSARPRMVDQALANEEPCLKCHTDKRGPFLFEHAAVRIDGCESCHFPHGSTNARLLKRPVLFTVCLECHTGGGSAAREKASPRNLLLTTWPTRDIGTAPRATSESTEAMPTRSSSGDRR